MAEESYQEEFRVVRVLAIDDDEATLLILRRILQSDQCSVDTAPTGKAALRRLLDSPYDVVIADIHMPEMDGPKLFRFLEDHMPQYKTRVVFLTGDTSSQETRTFLEQAGCPYTFKPINIQELQTKVQEVLERDAEASELLAQQMARAEAVLTDLQREAEKRVRRRVAMEKPIRVRTDLPEDNWAEVTRTINVSRDGISFISERSYRQLMDVFVCFPYTGENEMEQRATVVRVTPLPDRGFAVAIKLANIFMSATGVPKRS